MESLMPFNNELLVREIAGFPCPVIAGIGHDKDVPLAAMAADVMVSTPTAAANLLNDSWVNALLLIERFEGKIFASCGLIFEKYKIIENKFRVSLQNFKNSISNSRTEVEKYAKNYVLGFGLLCDRLREKLQNMEKLIELNNPERNLKLGYSIATLKGRVVRKTGDAKAGDNLNIKVSDGIINTEVL